MNERISTRCVFFIAGLATSAWEVMVPFAKLNTDANEALLGILLLCLGGGAIISMPLAGPLSSRFGCRKIISYAVLIILLSMPFLTLANNPIVLGLLLLIFGTGVGLTDCAMNIQAILVEKNEFCLITLSTSLPALLTGYLCIGAGCANIVPVMFSQIGKQQSMPQMVAVPAVTTMGYIGVLAGPAMIGFIAHQSTLPFAFLFVAALIFIVVILAITLRKNMKLSEEV